MKKVIIGFDEKGNPYVMSAPKKVEVVFKESKVKPLSKLVRTWRYQIKSIVAKG